jgi:hypothetical protein
MPQQMTGVLVLIASPDDTVDERIAVSEALADWNVIRGRRQGSALLGWRFEKHAVARLGGRAQEIINEQAVNQSDAGRRILRQPPGYRDRRRRLWNR